MNPNAQNQQPQMPGGQPYGMPPAGIPVPAPYPPATSTIPQGAIAQQPQPMAVPMPPAPPIAGQQLPGMPAAQMPGVNTSLLQGQPVASGSPATLALAPDAKATTQRVATSNPNSTQNMLEIAEIRDGIVIMNDGSFRSVVMVNSINFDLMSPQEQEAVEYNYQNFLNSLYFPIQIFLRSQKVDITPYIEKLDKIRSEHDNMLLALLMEDYITYMETLAQQTNIMDKNFYIIIPFFPHVDIQKAFSQSKNFLTGFTALFGANDTHVTINEGDLEKAKSELRNRVQTVMDGLLQSNVRSLPLDTKELIELFYDTYNPDTATRQQLKNFSLMDADIVTKGKGLATQPHLERELS